MKYFFLFVSVLVTFNSFSQDFKFGQIMLSELEMKSYANDTSASAVVIREFGNAYVSNEASPNIIFEYHIKIKILTDKGLDHGNIEIPVYKSDNNRFEEVSDIIATTYYTGDNNGLQQATLDPKKIFRENKSKRWDAVKFAMPNVRAGSVIEYSYKLKSPYLFNFHNWTFQTDIPKMHSEYLVHIPAVYNYNVTLRGALQLDKKVEPTLEKECFQPGGGYKYDCSKITYLMTDIPALIPEEHMTAISNFQSAISFELSDYTDYNNVNHKMTKEWKDVDEELKKGDYFGSQIRKKNLLKTLPVPVQATDDDLTKAKAAYNFVKNWFRWNNIVSFSADNINKSIDGKTGNSGEINLSLIAVLNNLGLNTEAVLLSTRDNGIVNKLFPILSDFNYVVAKVNIGNESYLLDATEPLLPFGLLPLRCINDQGRVISMTQPSYWIDLKASQKLTTTRIMNLVLHENGKITGAINTYSMGYAALSKRNMIKKFNSIDEYIENIDEKMPKIKILKSEIRNLDSIDAPLSEEYEVEIDAYNGLEDGGFMFNPYMLDRITENPFKLAERSYPVDLGSASDNRISMTLEFPEDYEIVSKVPVMNLALPAGGGRFITTLSNTDKSLTFAHGIILNKAIYTADEYPYLKEFYNKIVQTEKTDILFKKKQ